MTPRDVVQRIARALDRALPWARNAELERTLREVEASLPQLVKKSYAEGRKFEQQRAAGAASLEYAERLEDLVERGVWAARLGEAVTLRTDYDELRALHGRPPVVWRRSSTENK